MPRTPSRATLRLGDTEVARIGLGTNRLFKTPEHVAFVAQAIDAGVGVVDTAHTYADGESEATIGAALSPVPNGCVVATKGGWASARSDVLRAEIEKSLERLQTESIGLYYLHRPDPETPLEESLRAIKEYRDSGAIRHVGLSNVGVEQIERGRELVPIVAVQNHYNVAERTHEDVLEYCTREGIVFVPYFPLRSDGESRVTAIAEAHDATPTQVLLAGLLARSPLTLPIPGTLSLDHVKENLAALRLKLSDDELDELDLAPRSLRSM